ncbi:patatin-like phospholipase family protein [Candidatus Tisiphia endosymbiont of Dascillus cervinus]|uniref:patatin-like phospholipase family protein n=1 Tax=Candidatus Tisiphia endosymbiont of Dascillus cervinus TaxID=3066253 RepID=UPI00312C7D07
MGDIGEAKLNKIDKIKENRILSISGGGIKGIAELVVLAAIEEMTGKSISELFSVITGTSVGGLIATLLTIPKEKGSTEPLFSAKQALELFENTAADIFPQKWYFNGPIGNIFSHKYSQKPLKAMLEKYLGNSTLDEAITRVIIPVFDVSGKNDPNKVFDSHTHNDVLKKEVVLATTAAPTYFKVVVNKEGVGGFGYDAGVPYALVDGGLSANIPAGSAIGVLKEGMTLEEQVEMLKHTMLCSINFEQTHKETAIPSKKLDGSIGWVTKGNIINKIMKATEHSAITEVKKDLPEAGQFTEISIPIPKECKKLDNVKPDNIAKLKEIGRQYVENNKELLENLCKTLVESVNREESLKAANIDESNVSSALVASDNTNEEQDNNASSTASNRVISNECDKQQLLIKDLDDSQYETLQKGLSTLTPRESQLLEMFLQVLDNTQIEALSGRISSIINGNHMDEIPELTNSQNMLLNSFSKMFIPDNDYNTCGQEALAQEVPCDGRGSDFSHAPPEVY